MAFCEQCGARLSPGVRFCEECGAEIGSPADAATSQAWMNDWRQGAKMLGGEDLGLILTREQVLLSQLVGSADSYHQTIHSYCEAALRRGVAYRYLDLDSCPFYSGAGDVVSVVTALRQIVELARPKYLLILGNEKVIGVSHWENVAHDGDDEVESDLPYATLCTESPWENRDFDFDAVLRVGRVPSYIGETVEAFVSYFRNAAAAMRDDVRVVPYGLSALVWQAESDDEFGAVSSRKVDVSPEVTKNNVKSRMGFEANLLFFNLHGSNQTKFWYGQEGWSYPEAFAPQVLAGIDRPYFIGVEACYGARYLGGLTPEDSIVLTALQNHCLALLGSSRIAFGARVPKGFCADVVVGDYIKGLNEGLTSGDAHIEGLRELCLCPETMDDSDIKTLAEFALYGDPSTRLTFGAKSAGCEPRKNGSSSPSSKASAVPMPDIHRAVRLAICEIDAKIEALIDDFIHKELLSGLSSEDIASADQKTYRVSNGLMQKIVRARQGVISRVAKVYFDDHGTIKKALVSK